MEFPSEWNQVLRNSRSIIDRCLIFAVSLKFNTQHLIGFARVASWRYS